MEPLLQQLPYIKKMKDLSFNTVRGHKDIYNEVMRGAPVTVQASLTFDDMVKKLQFQRTKRFKQPMDSVEEIVHFLVSDEIEGVSKHYRGHVALEQIDQHGNSFKQRSFQRIGLPIEPK